MGINIVTHRMSIPWSDITPYLDMEGEFTNNLMAKAVDSINLAG